MMCVLATLFNLMLCLLVCWDLSLSLFGFNHYPLGVGRIDGGSVWSFGVLAGGVRRVPSNGGLRSTTVVVSVSLFLPLCAPMVMSPMACSAALVSFRYLAAPTMRTRYDFQEIEKHIANVTFVTEDSLM